MFGQDRDSLRRFFLSSWEKRQQGLPLQPLEDLVARVVEQHPEYHALLADPDAALTLDSDPAHGGTNPFLHMAMHVTLAEQLGSDRPSGFRAAYRQLVERSADAHQAEHRMMDCLGQALWEAQRSGTAPDEKAYLACLTELGGRTRK